MACSGEVLRAIPRRLAIVPTPSSCPHISTNRSVPTKPPTTSFISPHAHVAANNSPQWCAQMQASSCIPPISRSNQL
jgi:hypothetical protein